MINTKKHKNQLEIKAYKLESNQHEPIESSISWNETPSSHSVRADIDGRHEHSI